jgi:hypothetical protein
VAQSRANRGLPPPEPVAPRPDVAGSEHVCGMPPPGAL